MSRILEFQPADEQTVVARVLLELHQAIDVHFPDAKGTSRQFTKTVLSSGAESTAVDQKPGQQPELNSEVMANAQSQRPHKHDPSQTPPKNQFPVAQGAQGVSGIEFSKMGGNQFAEMTATAMEEASWSRWLTRLLVITFICGGILLAWIYLFGSPF